MSLLNTIVIMGTIFVMFLFTLTAVVDHFKLKQSNGVNLSLDDYKKSKRIRLLVDGKLMEDLSLAEHESLCVSHGIDPSSPVELRVDLKGPDKSDNITPFPKN